MEKENDPYLGNHIFNMKAVRTLIEERDKNFKAGKDQIEKLKSAKIPEPHLKPQGGAPYKMANYKKEKDQAVVNLRDKHQKLNQQIGNEVLKELERDGLKDDIKKIREKGLHHYLDKGIIEHNQTNKTDLSTQREINNYISKNGFRPDKSKDQDKPMDKEPSEKIPDPVKSETKEVRTMERNKKDMGIDRDR